MMLTIYIIAAVVGLGLALIAAIAGEHSHDTDAHVEIGHQEVDHGAGESQMWLPFLSLRFWTYAFAGFGLTGLLLTVFTDTLASAILLIALCMGATTGTMVALMVRIAQRSQVDSSIHTREMLGLEADVLVAIRPGQLGKVRFSTKGEIIDMIAVSDDNIPIEAGMRALVVAVEGDHARVIALGTYEGENILARS